jgi:pantetheine-phosphate adenylyltransferase
MTDAPRIAVFPGTFDPLTNGHVDIVERAGRLFDIVIVAILRNPGKQPLFSLEERLATLAEVFEDRPAVTVDAFDGLLVDFARRRGAAAVVRGLRRAGDFDYEVQMADMNRHLAADVETVFLAPSPQVAFISSTLVREIVALGGAIDGLVPDAVRARVLRRRQAGQHRSA